MSKALTHAWEVSFRERNTGRARRVVYINKRRAESVARELRELGCTAVVVKPSV